jgi:hypothetical protein
MVLWVMEGGLEILGSRAVTFWVQGGVVLLICVPLAYPLVTACVVTRAAVQTCSCHVCQHPKGALTCQHYSQQLKWP